MADNSTFLGTIYSDGGYKIDKGSSLAASLKAHQKAAASSKKKPKGSSSANAVIVPPALNPSPIPIPVPNVPPAAGAPPIALGPFDLVDSGASGLIRQLLLGALDAFTFVGRRWLGLSAFFSPSMVANGELGARVYNETFAGNTPPDVLTQSEVVREIEQFVANATIFAQTSITVRPNGGLIALPVGGMRGDIPNVSPQYPPLSLPDVATTPPIPLPDVVQTPVGLLPDILDDPATARKAGLWQALGVTTRPSDIERLLDDPAINIDPSPVIGIETTVQARPVVKGGVLSVAVSQIVRPAPRERKRKDTKGKGASFYRKAMTFVNRTFGEFTELADLFWVMSWNIYVNVDGRPVPAMLYFSHDDFATKMHMVWSAAFDGVARMDMAGVVVDMSLETVQDATIALEGRAIQGAANKLGWSASQGVDSYHSMLTRHRDDMEKPNGLSSLLPSSEFLDQSRSGRVSSLVSGLPSL